MLNKKIITTITFFAIIIFILCVIIIFSKDKSFIEKIVYCFTVISSSSILATIITYVMQKVVNDKEKIKIKNYYIKVIKKERKKLKRHYEKLNEIYEIFEFKNFDTAFVRFRKDSYSFIFNKKGRKTIIKSFFINPSTMSILTSACTDSIKADIELYKPFRKIVDESIILDRRLYAVFSKYSISKKTKTKISSHEIDKILEYELFSKRKLKLKKIKKIKIPALQ